MRNKKGQALVEFVIILPIFIFMLLAVIDVGKIIFVQNRLENKMSQVLDLYRNQKSYDEILSSLTGDDDTIKLEIKNEENKKVTFTLKKEVTIVTPGLSLIFKNPYDVTINEVVSYE